MGTSSNELDHASSPKASEHETRTNGDVKESSPTAADELYELDHASSPSMSEHETLTDGTPDAEMLLFTIDCGDDKENHEIYNANVALSTLSPELTDSTLELGSKDPTTSPPTQVMERPSGSKYRIPSSVFTRSKSNTPDWSIASNDSLFSIQMGNMSFIKDDMWKSGEIGLKSGELEMIKNGDLDILRPGELGFKSGELEMQSGDLGTKNGDLGMGTGEPETIPGEAVIPIEPSKSSHMFSYSQTPYIATSNSGKTAELGVAIETMKEVIREAADHKSTNSISDARTSNGRSSTESFAFSSGADNSLRVGSRAKSDTGSSHKAQSQSPTQAKSDTGSSHKAQSQSPTQSTSQPKNEPEPKGPAAALHTATTGWFSWMSCYWCRPYCCL